MRNSFEILKSIWSFTYIYLKGLKTGMYYLRSRAAADAIKFTVDTAMLKVKKE